MSTPTDNPTIALLHARLRLEERLLIDEFETRGIRVRLVDLRQTVLDLGAPQSWAGIDVAVDRCLSAGLSIAAGRVLEAFGVRTINTSRVASLCSDKLATSVVLQRAGLPAPRTLVAFSPEAGVRAAEALGYPCVVKPLVGSWGRLVSRINDRDSAEAIFEHRATLGGTQHQAHYVQEHVEKPGRDLRVFVIGGRAVAAIERRSEHWVTNTARGAQVHAIELTGEIAGLGRVVSTALGADIIAVDLLECPRRGLLVNEVNHSVEFRNSIETTGVNIPTLIVDHVSSVSAEIRASQGVAA